MGFTTNLGPYKTTHALEIVPSTLFIQMGYLINTVRIKMMHIIEYFYLRRI